MRKTKINKREDWKQSTNIADEKGRGFKTWARSTTFVFTARELEMQTSAKVNIQVNDSKDSKNYPLTLSYA